MKTRFPFALAAYVAIGIVATFTLDEPRVRGMVWLVLAAFALKSYIVGKAGK